MGATRLFWSRDDGTKNNNGVRRKRTGNVDTDDQDA